MKPRLFRPSSIRILAPAVLLLAVGGAARAEGRKSADGDGRPAFRTEEVKRDTLKATAYATGTVEPEEEVDVGAQVSGAIMKFGPAVDFGAPVKQGQVLAEIDPKIYKIQLAKAEAALKAAEAALDLARSQNAAPATVKAAEAGVEVAKAGLEESRANLDYCTITAPVDGVVIDRRVNLGQTVTAGLSAPGLFLLAKDLSRMQVWASVNEADVGNIRVGQDATFTVDARPGKTYHGTVSQIRLNAATAQNVVSYTVVIGTKNPPLDANPKKADGQAASPALERELLPYLTANVTFHVAERKDALLVPNAALRWRPQLSQVAPDFRDEYEQALRKKPTQEPGAGARDTTHGVVWVEDKGFVRPVRVTAGLTDGARTEVLKVEGDDRLDEGAPVVVGDSRDGDGPKK